MSGTLIEMIRGGLLRWEEGGGQESERSTLRKGHSRRQFVAVAGNASAFDASVGHCSDSDPLIALSVRRPSRARPSGSLRRPAPPLRLPCASLPNEDRAKGWAADAKPGPKQQKKSEDCERF